MRINLLSSAARCAATSRKFYQFVLNFRYCINFVIVVFSQLFACIFCPGQAVPTIVTFFDRFFAKAFHLFSATSLSVFGSQPVVQPAVQRAVRSSSFWTYGFVTFHFCILVRVFFADEDEVSLDFSQFFSFPFFGAGESFSNIEQYASGA